MRVKVRKYKNFLGWKEWLALDEIGLPAIKAKIDTGAKTSALHAFNIRDFTKDGVDFVEFDIHPLQKNKKITRRCLARVVDRRFVSDSNGNKEKRFVIESLLRIGNTSHIVEITLTNRDTMLFRMLLGREAIKKMQMQIDPSRSFLQGRIKKIDVLKLYASNPS